MNLSIAIPNIPKEAMDLILSDNTVQTCFSRFIKTGETRTIELFTFGLYITPISHENEDGKKTVGHVVYWLGGDVTISNENNGKSTLIKKIKMNSNPSPDKCVKLYLEAKEE